MYHHQSEGLYPSIISISFMKVSRPIGRGSGALIHGGHRLSGELTIDIGYSTTFAQSNDEYGIGSGIRVDQLQ